MANDNKVLKAYELAKETYKDFGVDTDKAMETLSKARISLHCWQVDDIKGFEEGQAESQNVVTGNFPGAARNAEEVRQDLAYVFSLTPSGKKINIHSVYAEPHKPTSREKLDVTAFDKWIDWAKENNAGIDYNGSFFAHKMMDGTLSLTSSKKEVRDFWIEHLKSTRETAFNIGKKMNDVCVLNTWIPDGLKDNPADRSYWRELLIDSLDKGFEKKYDKKHLVDALEGKLFGIGTECFVAGSYDFYLAYAMKNNLGICLDSGHYHPTEQISDKFSALKFFFEDILLHVSRGVRWDSDHVVIDDDSLTSIMTEAKRANLLGSEHFHIGLDYFDASINRVYASAIGMRAASRAMLRAILEPTAMIKKAELGGDYSERLALSEEAKALPFNAVWDMACLKAGVPVGKDWLESVRDYTKKYIANR